MRPNWQVRRRHGKTEVDAIAAARAVLSGETDATPKVLQRSAAKTRTQALNQLRALLVTAPDDLRARLRDQTGRELLNMVSRIEGGASRSPLSLTFIVQGRRVGRFRTLDP